MLEKSLLSAAVANWTGQFISLATNFLLAPFVLHSLGDTRYGILALVGSVIVQGSHLDLGIRSALIKFVAEHHSRGETQELRALIATALRLYCLLGAIAIVLTLLISPFLPSLFNVPSSESDTMVVVGLLMGAQLAISIPGSTPDAILSGLQRYDILNAISVVWTVLSATTTVAVLLAGGGIVAVATVASLTTVSMLAVKVICVRRVAPQLPLSFRGAQRQLIRKILTFSASLFAIDLSNSLQGRSAEIIIGLFLPVGLISPYSLTKRLSGVPQLIADRFLWAFVPVTSHLYAQGEMERVRVMYLTGTRITLALCLPFAAVVMVLAGPLLTLWIGQQYAEYAPIAVILAITGILEVSCTPGGTVLQGMGRHHKFAIIAACAAAANITLSTLLVRPFGLMGMAIGALLPAAIITFGWKLGYTLRVLQVDPRELLMRSLLPVFWPFLLSVISLLALKSVTDISGFLSVGCVAATGVGVFIAAYITVFSDDSEREFVRGTIAAIRHRLYAAGAKG